jgi:hypothetical protein
MPPGIAGLATLDHDVIERTLGEQMADGESGVTGADDDRGMAFDGRPPRPFRESR